MGAKKVCFGKNSYAMSKGYTKMCSVKINFVFFALCKFERSYFHVCVLLMCATKYRYVKNLKLHVQIFMKIEC